MTNGSTVVRRLTRSLHSSIAVCHSAFIPVNPSAGTGSGEFLVIYFGRKGIPFAGLVNAVVKWLAAMRALAITFFYQFLTGGIAVVPTRAGTQDEHSFVWIEHFGLLGARRRRAGSVRYYAFSQTELRKSGPFGAV